MKNRLNLFFHVDQEFFDHAMIGSHVNGAGHVQNTFNAGQLTF